MIRHTRSARLTTAQAWTDHAFWVLGMALWILVIHLAEKLDGR